MNNTKGQNDLPVYLFHQGANFAAYDLLGCHYSETDQVALFRTWAPNAKSISVVGDFNKWKRGKHLMNRVSEAGLWEAVVEDVHAWDKYKLAVETTQGESLLKADPFAFHSETNFHTASIVYDIQGYQWQDEAWQKAKLNTTCFDKPVNIYELHTGSWRKHHNGSFYSYADLADSLIPYVKEMAYTHIQLMPIMEHPSEETWGYGICGYYAPTSRHGAPKDLMHFIDQCHAKGIGVILDWVPAGFSKEQHGLAGFDGTPLYELEQQENQDGTLKFDYSKNEVRSFLISNACYWLDVFHADGLRLDSVSSIIYKDFGMRCDELGMETFGGEIENPDGIDFLKQLNKTIVEQYPQALIFAHEPTTWPMVTKHPNEGGLGFSFKWNIGWIKDMLEYIGVDPLYRNNMHEKITFSFYYAFSENYVIPISHLDVRPGKKSLLEKMPGDYETKFAGVRAFIGYMMTHPGKKLSFMGNEFGQFNEWDHHKELDWFLLEYSAHQCLCQYIKALNNFYLNNPELWEVDYSWDGFKWISEDNREQNIIVFMRMDKAGSILIVVQNFAPVARHDYRFGVPRECEYREVFNSDEKEFGGWGNVNQTIATHKQPMHGFMQSIGLTIPPLSTICIRPVIEAVNLTGVISVSE